MTTAPVASVAPPHPPGTVLAPGYSVIEHLSRAQILDVYDVWDARRYCRCVAKMLRPDRMHRDRDRARLRREGELLRRFTHPHIVRAYETLEQPVPIVILETLSGDTLSHLIDNLTRRLPVADIAILGLQLGSAVRYLHADGWLHLDLKPSNVVVDAGFAKLLDLSLARPPGPAKAGLGTRPYLSPEQARGGDLSEAADVWGLGAVLFEVASGELPFQDTPSDRYPQLDRPAPSVRKHRRLPAEIATLIDACLDLEPKDRPTIDAMLATLERFA